MGGSNSIFQSNEKTLPTTENHTVSSNFSLKSTGYSASGNIPSSELFKGSKLFEAMELINRYPILCTAFYRFFQSGRWIHQLLSSNPNFSSWSKNISNNESLKLLTSESVKSLSIGEGIVAVFLACSFPIFMQSSEFQLWLEKQDTEDVAVEKEVINIDTMDFRRFDEIQHYVDEPIFSDGEDTVDARPIYATCVNSVLAPSLKMRHRRKSHVSSDPFFIRADTGRMRAMVDEVLSTVTKEQLENFHQPSHWMSQIESLLSTLPFPVIIARSKTNARGLVPGLYSESVRIVAVNEMYGSTFGKKPAQLVGRSFQDAIFKDHRVTSKEILVSPELMYKGISEESMNGLYPMKLQLESKCRGEVASSALFIKPVHHVLADPEYNYVIAVHYDMSNNFSRLDSTFSKSFAVGSSKKTVTDGESIVSMASFIISPRQFLLQSSPSTSSSRKQIYPSTSNLITESIDGLTVPLAASSPSDAKLEEWLSHRSNLTASTKDTMSPIASRRSTAINIPTNIISTRRLENDLPVIEDILNLLSLMLF